MDDIKIVININGTSLPLKTIYMPNLKNFSTVINTYMVDPDRTISPIKKICDTLPSLLNDNFVAKFSFARMNLFVSYCIFVSIDNPEVNAEITKKLFMESPTNFNISYDNYSKHLIASTFNFWGKDYFCEFDIANNIDTLYWTKAFESDKIVFDFYSNLFATSPLDSNDKILILSQNFSLEVCISLLKNPKMIINEDDVAAFVLKSIHKLCSPSNRLSYDIASVVSFNNISFKYLKEFKELGFIDGITYVSQLEKRLLGDYCQKLERNTFSNKNRIAIGCIDASYPGYRALDSEHFNMNTLKELITYSIAENSGIFLLCDLFTNYGQYVHNKHYFSSVGLLDKNLVVYRQNKLSDTPKKENLFYVGVRSKKNCYIQLYTYTKTNDKKIPAELRDKPVAVDHTVFDVMVDGFEKELTSRNVGDIFCFFIAK